MGPPRWRFEPAKTQRSKRTVVIDSEGLFWLRKHRTQQAEDKLRAGALYEEHNLAFANEVGGPLHQHNLSQRVFKRILRRAKLPEELTPYCLRHSAALALLKARESLKVVSELLGPRRPRSPMTPT